MEHGCVVLPSKLSIVHAIGYVSKASMWSFNTQAFTFCYCPCSPSSTATSVFVIVSSNNAFTLILSYHFLSTLVCCYFCAGFILISRFTIALGSPSSTYCLMFAPCMSAASFYLFRSPRAVILQLTFVAIKDLLLNGPYTS